MKSDQVERLLRDKLGDDVHRRGWVCYTGLDSLTHGPYYLMGYNPRVDPANKPLLESITNVEKWSAYTQQCWKKSCRRPCIHLNASGYLLEREPHQRRVAGLAEALKTKPECIFSANAIFVESETAPGLQDADSLWEKCWEVHRVFLAEVRPEWIICLGNGKVRSSYSLLIGKATRIDSSQFPVQSSRSPRAKAFRATFDLVSGQALTCNVLGLPHPSRWNTPTGLQAFMQSFPARS